MSYSFGIKGTSKADALSKVAEALAGVVVSQPVHAVDQEQAQAAAEAFVGLLADDDTQDVTVSVSGSVWNTDAGLQQASCNVNVGLTKRV